MRSPHISSSASNPARRLRAHRAAAGTAPPSSPAATWRPTGKWLPRRRAAARRAREEAEAGILEASARAEAEIEAFRASYPGRLAFEYRLDDKAKDRPFLIEAMWHDGRFTYVRSRAQESPALYELRDGEPSLVAFDLTEDGLYIARHVLGDGWLQVGDKRVGWRFTPAEALR